jgi:hypothetical protein
VGHRVPSPGRSCSERPRRAVAQQRSDSTIVAATTAARLIPALVLLALAALLAGCGGGGSGDDAKAEITQSWETFFDGGTPAAKRVALLQNGAKFASLIEEATRSPLAAKLTAEVTKVEPHGDSADVTYTLIFDKNPVLEGAKGTAVHEDGVWKVGTRSFCELAALQGAKPKECAAAATE